MHHPLAFGMLGTQELLIILVILLLIFGGARLPQLAKGLGKSISEFRRGAAGTDEAAALGEAAAQHLE